MFFLNETQELNVTENITEIEPEVILNETIQPAEVKIENVEYPASLNVSEDFEVKAWITSLYNNSVNVTVELQSTPDLKIQEPVKFLSQISVNETVSVVKKLVLGPVVDIADDSVNNNGFLKREVVLSKTNNGNSVAKVTLEA